MSATLRTMSPVLVLALSTVLSSCWLSHERDECPPVAHIDPPASMTCTTPAALLRWTTFVPAGADAFFYDVGGASAEDVWVVGSLPPPYGGGVVLRNVGGGWSIADVPIESDGWIGIDAGADDVWLVGGESAAAHFDGIEWTGVDLGGHEAAFGAIWRDCASRTWIGGENVLFRVESTAIERVVLDPEPPPARAWAVTGIWGTGPRDIWIAGSEQIDAHGGFPRTPRLWRGDGTSWTHVVHQPDGAAPGLAADVWGTEDDDVWVVGGEQVGHAHGSVDLAPTIDHWDGRSWMRAELPDGGVDGAVFTAVWGTSRSDVWALDAAGPLFHFDGARWARIDAPTAWAGGSRPQGFSPDPCHVFIADGDTIIEGAP